MSIPNYQAIVAELAAAYPEAWAHAHRGGPRTEEFVRLLAARLHAIDPKVGLNGKRGQPNDLSDDCVCYLEPGQSIDVRTGRRVSVMDVIGGAGGPNPTPTWGEVWDPNNVPTAATWVQPDVWVEPVPVPTPPVEPTPGPTPPTPGTPCDLGPMLEELRELRAGVNEAHAAAAQARDMLASLLAVLDPKSETGLQIDANVALLGRIGGTIRLPEKDGQ